MGVWRSAIFSNAGVKLFDGVNPDELSERELAYELLRNAIASGTVGARFP